MAWWSASKSTWVQFSSADKKPNMATHICSPPLLGRDRWVLTASWSVSLNLVQWETRVQAVRQGLIEEVTRSCSGHLMNPSPAKEDLVQELKERVAQEKNTTLFCERCGLLKRVASLLEFSCNQNFEVTWSGQTFYNQVNCFDTKS